ncbi:cytochrome P450 [Crepidotus variabilis]|uniref:Cytochrome P450 n=1 Tax=Crepidotus variabilis TaxID=179855 RepID=A0A9P6JUQ4_9AGAR|nr:cytochrome P450 [Crepidotus variabilis]
MYFQRLRKQSLHHDKVAKASWCYPDGTQIPYGVIIICLVLFMIGAFSRTQFQPLRLPYPPGPPPSSWLGGNIKDVPGIKPWLRYTDWKKRYGNLVHFRIYGQHNIIVNDYDTAVELCEKRSNVFSDRPSTTIIDLMGWDFSTALKPYGDHWRVERRMFQQAYKPDVVMSYWDIQTQKVQDLLYGLLTTPNDFRNHIKTVAAAVIMSVVYSHDISPKDDYYVKLAEATVGKLSESIFPGAAMVNAIPILRHLPEWFPGAGFHTFAREARKLTDQMLNAPIAMVEKKMENGTAQPCLASELLSTCKNEKDRMHTKCVCATSYAAGADTTVASIEAFFYVIAKYPDVQRKAQEEIDRVIGNDRIPTFNDRSSLLYVEALFREVLRWMPALPLGLAHGTSADDIYEGQYIPKGASIIVNTWAMTHNPDVYPDPDTFNPDRFFTEDGKLNDDEVLYTFGFGRRVCPGRHLASNTIWLTIATVLALFNMGKKMDADGNEIPVEADFTTGLMTHPFPYECSIVPRSDVAERLILDA